MAEQTRSSVMAIKKESTEGTIVVPAAGGDFIALQDGFSFEPGFETLENAELRSSIGKAKPIMGMETPKASFNHYVRHSGTEGVAPAYGALLESVFGATSTASTEYDTVAGSTAAVLNVDSAEGANFARGHALLVKDGTNGYNIRPVHSVATDALTLGFNLASAPASGVNLGKAIKYTPANSGHPSLSLWEYRANGGAVEAVAGAKVTEFSMEVKAGEMINGSYSLEGTKYYFNPITIASADRYLDFDDGSVRAAVVAAKTYRDPHELAQAIEDAMNAVSSGITVTYNDSGASAGKFTIVKASGTLSLLLNTGTNKANTIADKIGFGVSADKTGGLTYTSDTAQSWASAITPSYDSSDPLVAKNNEVLLGSATDVTAITASSLTFKLANEKTQIADISAESGVSGNIISGREATVELVALLTKHDADKFRRFRENEETRFCFNFGTKSGGNWQAGKCGCLYIPSATISSLKLGDSDGLVTLEMTLTAFVDSSGNGEAYLNFV